MITSTEAARALGKLNKGVKKTMSKSAIEQRQQASKRSVIARKEKKPLSRVTQ